MKQKITLLLSYKKKVFEIPISKEAEKIILLNNKENKLKLKFEGISYEYRRKNKTILST
jgi:hypothetical protein